ncbi:hypothetical protein ACFS27_04360 [Promicromonospora vindobonensis]|uniref:Uncharacterized protein n=1 Tax=Promicromonospora vindobonensis TaxID=195748 RepID=A0ABW5VM53_9MICO
MRRSTAAIIVTGVLLAGAAAPPASAAPGDPAPGWSTRPGETHRDVAVAGSGRVFSVSLPETGTLDHSALEHGYQSDWSRIEVPPSSQGGVIAGPGDYAMAVTGNVSRVFNGTSWNDPVTISPEIWRSKLVSNKDGDAALLWSGGSGLPFLSRLERGGSWVTGRVTGAPADVPRDVAINNAGKVTVVWAAPTGASTAEIRRTVLRPGGTSWFASRRIGTVNTARPPLTLVAEGEGRETVLAGNKLWWQETVTEKPTYQFRTSVRAKLATGDTATRLVWAEEANTEHQFYTRAAGTSWGPRVMLWEHPGPADDCDQGNEVGVGMVPGGRAYIATAIRSEVGETTEVCGGPYAAFQAVDRWSRVLGASGLFYSNAGSPFQIATGTAGPIVLEYEPGDWYVDWRMRFFSR